MSETRTQKEWAAARVITDGGDGKAALADLPKESVGIVNSRALLLRSADLLKDIQGPSA